MLQSGYLRQSGLINWNPHSRLRFIACRRPDLYFGAISWLRWILLTYSKIRINWASFSKWPLEGFHVSCSELWQIQLGDFPWCWGIWNWAWRYVWKINYFASETTSSLSCSVLAVYRLLSWPRSIWFIFISLKLHSYWSLLHFLCWIGAVLVFWPKLWQSWGFARLCYFCHSDICWDFIFQLFQYIDVFVVLSSLAICLSG